MQALGLINYQRRFLPNADEIMVLLNAYFKGRVTNAMHIKLDPIAKQAFNKIKESLANITYLTHPCDNAPLTLRTDASGIAIGAILDQQVNDGTEVLG